MAVERRDPVPPGRYWVWLMPEDTARWTSWTRAHAGKVSTRVTEGDPDSGYHVVFDVIAPVPWVGFGFPTIVESGTLPTTSQTVQAPAPEPGFAERLERGLNEGFAQVKTVVLIGAGIWILSKVLSNRR